MERLCGQDFLEAAGIIGCRGIGIIRCPAHCYVPNLLMVPVGICPYARSGRLDRRA